VTLRPGRNAIRLGGAIFVCSLLGFVSPHFGWLLLALFVGGLISAWREVRQLRRVFASLHVTRELPRVVARGEQFAITWRLQRTGDTDGTGTIPPGSLREEVPSEAEPRFLEQVFAGSTGAGELRLTSALMIPKRGRYRIGQLWLRLKGPRGFVEMQRSIELFDEVRVLPETFANRDQFDKDQGADVRMLDKRVFSRQQGDGTEFVALAEFREGDDPRRIDWRASARMQRPIIKRFQIERHRDVMILVDCGRLMGGQVGSGTKLDCAVDAGLMLGRVALQGGDRCGFGLFDHAVRGFLPPVSGIRSLNSLVDVVYDAPVQWTESDFSAMYAAMQARQRKRSLLVLLSDVLDVATTEQFRGSLLQLARQHVVLFAALRTPLLDEIITRPPQTIQQGAEQAVTYRLLHERELAIQSLRHGGIHVIDVTPAQLTAPLINQFLAIRRRNLV